MDKKYLVWEIIKIAREHRKIVEKRICDLGIHPSQHHFLMYIAQNGACAQNSIAEAMEVSAATVAVSLKKLEKGGYIEKRISPEDGRSNLVALTAKGEDVVQQSNVLFEEVDGQMFESLSEEQQKQLCDYMEIIIRNLKIMEDRQEE
ncbi:MAG: MarR family transcriptional regulator [Lachnospiraceae bacterium]|nr:MarR family transcriptional regulator [Lachnospiraceae bacterium]MBP3578747.1 MarR family transcriptional regulator [Lachnospiraceae bacterium]